MKKIRSALISSAIILGVTLCACKREYPAKDISDIETFLKDADITVSGSPHYKSIMIPEEFSDVYNNYNELQKKQGFDLKDYRSRDAVIYTFDTVSVRGEHTENTQVHIIVCDGRIIGADVAETAIDGEMKPVICEAE